MGIAVCSAKLSTPESLIFAADKALYKAKDAGRNNVQIFSEFEDLE
jgi:PleD family two-component response regulator